MKKFIIALFLLITPFILVGCFDYTEFPDMVEYEESAVLDIAKEKYNIESFIFTSDDIRGEVDKTDESKLAFLYITPTYGDEFLNSDNVEVAFTSFAGKNGNHDIQGMYSHFLCYAALGITSDGEAKFIYYNTNIHKDAKIADTIGSSDYPYDILPNEITDSIHSVDGQWLQMNQFLSKVKNRSPVYTEDCLSKIFKTEHDNEKVVVKYYRENGNIVYDIYYSEAENSAKTEFGEPKLVFSTSEKYGVIYNVYGFDRTPYFDVSYTVEQSTEDSSCDLIKGTAKIKDFGKKIVYSELSVNIEYYVLWNGENLSLNTSTKGTERNCTELTHGVLAERIEGVNHKESAKFNLRDFYILYEK